MPGCGAVLGVLGDQAAACAAPPSSSRLGFASRRWARRLVVPQQWRAQTAAPGVAAGDRRRLDFVLYGVLVLARPICCDVTLVSR